MPPFEHRITCLRPHAECGKDTELHFKLDGVARSVSLRIGKLSKQLLTRLSDRTLDLLEIAALVYAVDALVSRGGTTMRQMGRQWHRRFTVTMSMRDIDLWQQPDLKRALEELLLFLSNDRFEFNFVEPRGEPDTRTRFFEFDAASAWQPDRVLMFSGGLDSFSGALEEISDHHHSVALVSHFSATKIVPVQKHLQKALTKKLGEGSCRHYSIQVQIPGSRVIEGTHRTRSFLFAALGAIVADLFGRDRVSFHENGVVSLNLPPVNNVLGARATRSTHPKSLALFTKLLGLVFKNGMRVDNPIFWKTKTDVVSTIARLGFEDHIRDTHSCADVHNRNKQYHHCGRCSQCIDRRFAMLAAGLEDRDPAEAYQVDLMTGARDRTIDKEAVLSYVRNAHFFELARPERVLQDFPAALDAVGHLGEPAEIVLKRIATLLHRHGTAVSGVMRGILDGRNIIGLPDSSLLRLYAEDQHRQMLEGVVRAPPAVAPETDRGVTLTFDDRQQTVKIDGVVEIRKSATQHLLRVLAAKHLEASGRGLEPFEYPFTTAAKLTDLLERNDEGTVRKLVNRARSRLEGKLASAGLDEETGRDIIENNPWHGYRLNPELVAVRLKT